MGRNRALGGNGQEVHGNKRFHPSYGWGRLANSTLLELGSSDLVQETQSALCVQGTLTQVRS